MKGRAIAAWSLFIVLTLLLIYFVFVDGHVNSGLNLFDSSLILIDLADFVIGTYFARQNAENDAISKKMDDLLTMQSTHEILLSKRHGEVIGKIDSLTKDIKKDSTQKKPLHSDTVVITPTDSSSLLGPEPSSREYEVLKCLSNSSPLNVTEIAEKTNIPKPTVFRYLTNLVEAGFVSQLDGNRRNPYTITASGKGYIEYAVRRQKYG